MRLACRLPQRVNGPPCTVSRVCPLVGLRGQWGGRPRLPRGLRLRSEQALTPHAPARRVWRGLPEGRGEHAAVSARGRPGPPARRPPHSALSCSLGVPAAGSRLRARGACAACRPLSGRAWGVPARTGVLSLLRGPRASCPAQWAAVGAGWAPRLCPAAARGSPVLLRVGPLCYRPAGQELSYQQRPAWAQGRRPLGASSLPGGGGGARPHFQCGSSCRHLPLSACHRGQGAGPLRVFCGASSGLAPSAPLGSTRSVPGASVPGPSVPGPSVAGPVSSWTHLASVEHASAPVPQRTRGGVPSSPAPAAPLLALLCASHSLPAAAVGRLRDLAVTLACPAPPAQLTAQLLGSAPPPPPPSAMCPRQPVECARPRAGPQSSRPCRHGAR